jgi:FkbM family methyltransferase
MNVNARMIELSKNRIMFDIGASSGEYIPSMCKVGTMVYAFEPHPDNVKVCNDLFSHNKNLKVIQSAVSNQDGEANLFICSRTSVQHTLSTEIAQKTWWGHSLDNFMKVPTIKLDSFCQQHNISGKMGIKIDVEAAEEYVIEGAMETLKNNDCIVALETHGEIDANNLTRLMVLAGYKWWDADGNLSSVFERDRPYFCVRNDSSISPF